VARQENYLQRFQHVLAPLKAEARFEFIIIDCPPSLGILTLNALAAADSVIVPIQCEYYALEGLSVIVRVIDKLRDSAAAPHLTLEGIVMTMFARTNLSQQVVDDVRKHFGAKVYQTVIPRTVRLSEAPGFGKPITVYDAHSSAAAAYRALAAEVAGAMPQAHAETTQPAEVEAQTSPTVESASPQPSSSDPTPPPTAPSESTERAPYVPDGTLD
jgi:chromosome partitioning protein